MVKLVTHVVHYDYWYRTREGDSDFQSGFFNCFSEEEAEFEAEFYRNHKNVMAKSVVIEKLDKPFPAGSEYED
jgi:hypothetical protein